MLWNKDPRYTLDGFWRCRIKQQAANRERYHNLVGMRYSHVRLRNRRAAALYRRRKRREPQSGAM